MAGQQALVNFLQQGKALPTTPVGGNGGAPPTQATPAARARQAAGRQQLAAQAQKQAAQQAQAQRAQQRIQLQAQRQAQQGQRQAVDALQRQQRIGQAQQRLQQSQQREERLQVNTLATAVEGLTERARDTGSRLEGWAANVPTYGSVGLLLAVIFIFLWAIVPVNGGKTRAQLFWLTLTGRTRMTDTPDAGGTYTDPGASNTGTGSGQAPTAASNGHVQSFTDLLAQANIRDFGSSAV